MVFLVVVAIPDHDRHRRTLADPGKILSHGGSGDLTGHLLVPGGPHGHGAIRIGGSPGLRQCLFHIDYTGFAGPENAEVARKTDQTALEGEIQKCRGKLANPSFAERAPAEVVGQEKARLEEWIEKLAATRKMLAAMQGG